MNGEGIGQQGSPLYDVVVIGAGIVGSMVARELSRFALRVALVDKEPFPGMAVTKAGVSLVHSPLMCPPGTLKGRLCVDAPSRYKRLARELSLPCREVDELFLAVDPARMTNIEGLRKRGEHYGLEHCELIPPERIWELEPQVTRKAAGALHVRGLLALYPPEWAFALCENARENGVRIHLDTTVEAILRRDDSTYAVRTSRGSLLTRHIVNAAGLYVDEIARMAGDEDLRLQLTQGTMAILDASVSGMVRRTLYGSFSATHSQLITPTAHGNLMIGLGHFPTPVNKGDTGVTREKLLEVIGMAKELVPSLPEGKIISTFAGIRSDNTVAPNGDFLVAHSAKAPGVIHAAIGSPGLTAAPAVAELIIRMLGETGLALEENPAFAGDRKGWPRFSEASPEERERIISADPDYGHVVCRCERVTAGEIAAAVERGAGTLDSVKHVTRAGMGPCQGGCCGMAVINLMAERLGLRPDQVTKKGKGSEQIFPSAR